ncbi:unnamed protein product [Dibothriocephalus latus]|uniref:Uncharacterized protein n=1 Tax=Dibothriocephalus latus TaxID=60516 RepID=A0A3P6SN60_DIBLA|nr:unnamed protein product [Dibothriocephalus latus]
MPQILRSLDDDLLWDPAYTLYEYGRRFTYDLHGKKVNLAARFLQNPARYVEYIVREHEILLIVVGIVIITLIIGFIYLKGFLWSKFKLCCRFCRFRRRIKNMAKLKAQAAELAEVDSDKFAAEIYRHILDYKGVATTDGETDMVEFESARFVHEAIKQTGLAYESLITKFGRPTQYMLLIPPPDDAEEEEEEEAEDEEEEAADAEEAPNYMDVMET